MRKRDLGLSPKTRVILAFAALIVVTALLGVLTGRDHERRDGASEPPALARGGWPDGTTGNTT